MSKSFEELLANERELTAKLRLRLDRATEESNELKLELDRATNKNFEVVCLCLCVVLLNIIDSMYILRIPIKTCNNI